MTQPMTIIWYVPYSIIVIGFIHIVNLLLYYFYICCIKA